MHYHVGNELLEGLEKLGLLLGNIQLLEVDPQFGQLLPLAQPFLDAPDGIYARIAVFLVDFPSPQIVDNENVISLP